MILGAVVAGVVLGATIERQVGIANRCDIYGAFTTPSGTYYCISIDQMLDSSGDTHERRPTNSLE